MVDIKNQIIVKETRLFTIAFPSQWFQYVRRKVTCAPKFVSSPFSPIFSDRWSWRSEMDMIWPVREGNLGSDIYCGYSDPVENGCTCQAPFLPLALPWAPLTHNP